MESPGIQYWRNRQQPGHGGKGQQETQIAQLRRDHQQNGDRRRE